MSAIPAGLLDTVQCCDAVEFLRGLPDGCCDAVVTDPPYGCDKAEWDDGFPTEWFAEAKRVSDMQAVITGACGLKDTVPLVGEAFVDVIAAWNTNGLTRGPIGFNNWLGTVIAGKVPKQGQNVLRFTVCGDMPDHPTPKPLEFMRRLICRLTEPGDVICDPFMGSGTTAVAAILEGRHFVGCDISPEYVETARKRIAKALRSVQPALALEDA